MLRGSGRVVYDPARPGMKRRTHWWCVATVDREITRYYRWWVAKELKVSLKQPSWDAHISLIRGEMPPENRMHLWKKYDGKRIEFFYSPIVRQSGDTTGGDRPDNFWFVEIESPEITQIREELGFPCKWRYHLTVGRTY